MDIPKYKHDCDKCTYLGDFDNYDLYEQSNKTQMSLAFVMNLTYLTLNI